MHRHITIGKEEEGRLRRISLEPTMIERRG